MGQRPFDCTLHVGGSIEPESALVTVKAHGANLHPDTGSGFLGRLTGPPRFQHVQVPMGERQIGLPFRFGVPCFPHYPAHIVSFIVVPYE